MYGRRLRSQNCNTTSAKKPNMNDDTATLPSLDALLDQDLHDLINCMATRFNQAYNKYTYSAMISHEDLALEGYMGATLAYQSFDPMLCYTTNIVKSFRTHAFPYIKNAILTYCQKFSHQLSISQKCARDDWDTLIKIGVVHIDRQYGLNSDMQFDIPIGSGVDFVQQDIEDYFLVGFSELERNLVKDYIIDGYSLQELSDRYDICKTTVRKMITRLTERMRGRAIDYENH